MSSPKPEQRPAMAYNAIDNLSGAMGYVTDMIYVTPIGKDHKDISDAKIHIKLAMEILEKYANE